MPLLPSVKGEQEQEKDMQRGMALDKLPEKLWIPHPRVLGQPDRGGGGSAHSMGLGLSGL